MVAKCWEVFVKEASSVALNKTWSCLYKVTLLKVFDNVIVTQLFCCVYSDGKFTHKKMRANRLLKG